MTDELIEQVFKNAGFEEEPGSRDMSIKTETTEREVCIKCKKEKQYAAKLCVTCYGNAFRLNRVRVKV